MRPRVTTTPTPLRDHGWRSTAIALEPLGETIVWAMARSGHPVLAHHSRLLAAGVNSTLVAGENLTVGSTVWLPAEGLAPGR